MPLIAEELIVAGIGTSARNRPNILADSRSELLGVLNRLTMDLFLDAAVVNPFYIGGSEVVSYLGTVSGWPRPASALSVARIEAVAGANGTQPGMDDGTEIIVIQPDNRIAGSLEPSVVELGGIFMASGLGNASPTGGGLRFYFARRPVLLSLAGASTQGVDPLIPDDMAAYFVNGIGAYLAMKDQRLDETAALQAMRDGMRGVWSQLVATATPALRRTFQPRQAAAANTVPAA